MSRRSPTSARACLTHDSKSAGDTATSLVPRATITVGGRSARCAASTPSPFSILRPWTASTAVAAQWTARNFSSSHGNAPAVNESPTMNTVLEAGTVVVVVDDDGAVELVASL